MSNILIAAYQGGAASLLEPVARELVRRGHNVSRMAIGPARGVWKQATVTFNEVPDDAGPIIDTITNIAPDIVVSGTTASVDVEKWLWRAAHTLSIPSIGVLDSWMNLRERFAMSDDYSYVAPDALCVIDAAMESQLRNEAKLDARMHVIGHPYLEWIGGQAAARRSERAPTPGSPSLVYISEPRSFGPDGLQLGFESLDVARTVLNGLSGLGAVELLIKPHPRESKNNWIDWLADHPAPDGVKVHLTDKPVEALLEETDGVLGLCSIVLVAAAVAGVPVLSLQPQRAYVANRKLDEMPEVPVVTDSALIPNALAALLDRIRANVSLQSNLGEYAGSIERLTRVIETEASLNTNVTEPKVRTHDDAGARLNDLFDRLFPICRSISGQGLRESFDILSEYLPLEIDGIDSGTKVFDWTVPQEWNIRSARLTGPDGEVIADFERSNLEVMNYSSPVDTELSLDQLKPHLHSIERLPDAVPYVTSYYERDWGFCLPHRTYERLREGTYKASIESEFLDGAVNFGHCLIAGETHNEIVLSSYLCHPSLANNELGGPLVLAELFQRIKHWKRRRYSYRFILAPETIGSLCYLYRHGQSLQSSMVAGMVINCIGGTSDTLSYKLSRRGDSLLDRTVLSLKSLGLLPIDIRPFDPTHGSDERQYCSPGFDLPMSQISRVAYGTYDGYHNSLDTKDFMGIDNLIDSADKIEQLLLAIENAGPFENLSPYGEPQLGQRGLYPMRNTPTNRQQSTDTKLDGREFLDRILYVLNYSDGRHDMLDIANKCHCSVLDLAPVIETLEAQGLLRLIERENRAHEPL